MTIRIPEETFADKLLAMMGKKRAVWIPADVYKRFEPYVIMQARRESFWKALARPKNQEPSEGWFYRWNIPGVNRGKETTDKCI